MKNFLFIAIVCALTASCKQDTKILSSVPPKEFAEKLASMPDAQLVDVRTPEEFAGQKLDGAINIDWNSADFEKKAASLDKSKPVFVYCLAGSRSREAAEKLQEMGFAEVYDMQGGIKKWNADKLGDAAPGGMSVAEYNKVTASADRVLVSVFAEWCGPCKKMKPFMETLQQDMNNTIEVVRIDADQNQQLLQEINVEFLPTLLFFENGEQQWQHTGFMSESELKNKLR